MESVELGQAKLREIHEVMEQIALDSTKFFTKGNKAAGVRARKALQDLKQLAQDLRVAIQRCKSEGVHTRGLEHSATPVHLAGAPPVNAVAPPPDVAPPPHHPHAPHPHVDPLVAHLPPVPDPVSQHLPSALAPPQQPYAPI